ncbi:hypothetical protein [Mesorhizobium qingshengii]|uniref:hypothetical protein n=1 Tax=Mesorhizobium qingshengii TaxID=1165689 RepID=UPI00115FA156|nr:hypothetical protein [Mesorhizobium qingshengii]
MTKALDEQVLNDIRDAALKSFAIAGMAHIRDVEFAVAQDWSPEEQARHVIQAISAEQPDFDFADTIDKAVDSNKIHVGAEYFMRAELAGIVLKARPKRAPTPQDYDPASVFETPFVKSPGIDTKG